MNDPQNDDRTGHQNLKKLFLNIIESVRKQFLTRFSKCRELEATANFIRYPDSVKMEEINLQMFSWIDMDKFEMQLIEFQSSLIWKQKFIELEKIERKRLKKGIVEGSAEHELLRVWNAIPENIFMLKKLYNSITLHSTFYICL